MTVGAWLTSPAQIENFLCAAAWGLKRQDTRQTQMVQIALWSPWWDSVGWENLVVVIRYGCGLYMDALKGWLLLLLLPQLYLATHYSNGQTEQMNQEIKQYLHLFINYWQTDWAEWLTCAEFSYNDKIQTSTGHSPFYVNYGCHPHKGMNIQKEVRNQSAIELTQEMSKIWEETRAVLCLAAEQMKTYNDCKRESSWEYKAGDEVWLKGYNVMTDCPSKKLNGKWYRPFKILEKVGKATYKLKLLHTWKSIWPVVNKIFLTPYIAPTFNSQKNPP